MSKVLLVLDEMPESCTKCPCFQENYILNAFCGQTKKCISFDAENGFIKPDCCPLQLVPEKELEWYGDETDDYFRGYNECIDEIIR